MGFVGETRPCGALFVPIRLRKFYKNIDIYNRGGRVTGAAFGFGVIGVASLYAAVRTDCPRFGFSAVFGIASLVFQSLSSYQSHRAGFAVGFWGNP